MVAHTLLAFGEKGGGGKANLLRLHDRWGRDEHLVHGSDDLSTRKTTNTHEQQLLEFGSTEKRAFTRELHSTGHVVL